MRRKRVLPAPAVPLALALALAFFGAIQSPPRFAQAASPARIVQARINPEETPEFCHRQYEQCIEDCDKDPFNKTRYDLEACYSSCWSTYSGCGT
ncbi:MAG: hypothetical protein HQK81_07180 [Desulfovibrionaceae bacterium]|nr:hypothetical protein [Desulfovibrionaceae bacterium]MBF0513834.1 hypothetical protein [Desulfovibrionaceae bacterium]